MTNGLRRPTRRAGWESLVPLGARRLLRHGARPRRRERAVAALLVDIEGCTRLCEALAPGERPRSPMMTRLVSVGAAGSLGATVANLGGCGFGVLGVAGFATAATAFGSLGSAWGYEVMYASLALMLMSLAGSAWRHRCLLPTLLAVGGAAALLLAFHEAWDVTVFATLVVGGWLLLGVAVGWDARSAATACSTPVES